MSTRALKKLQKTVEDSSNLVERSSSDEEHVVVRPVKNRFVSLQEVVGCIEQASEASSEELAENKKTTTSNRGKKKRIKKQKAKLLPEDTGDEWLSLDFSNQQNESTKTTQDQDNCKIEYDLLKIESKHLQAENELKRIFGKAVGSFTGHDLEDNRRNFRRLDQQRNATQRVAKRFGGRIVRPRNLASWNIAKTGLSMILQNTDSSKINWFRFEHSPAYQKAQIEFWDASDRLDPSLFMTILRDNPFHISTLLQISDIYAVNDDYATSREMIEKAIAACEASFHPLFNITTNNCRLRYKQEENRPFFLVLFKYMLSACQRACFRTALEICKLIYSLDPDDDPLGMLLFIDYFCIRSKEYDYLLNFYDSFQAQRNLAQMPNFCYSYALALWLKATAKGASEETATDLIEQADKNLQLALMKFPTMLLVLLDKCSVEPHKKVTNQNCLSFKEQLKDGQGLKALYHLYASRCHGQWKDSEIMIWLEKNVDYCVDKNLLDVSDKLFDEYMTNRRTRYSTTPINVCRHVVLCKESEVKDVRPYLPIEIREKSINNYDPLPPVDSICQYSRPTLKRGSANRNQNSILGAFLRSLLPNYNPDAVELDEAQVQDGNNVNNAPQQLAVDFQQSVRDMLTAVRDLLAEVTPEPAPRENGDNVGGDANDWVEDFD